LIAGYVPNVPALPFPNTFGLLWASSWYLRLHKNGI